MSNTNNQKKRILKFLEEGGVLDRVVAYYELGIWEAPARIWDLRDDGHDIHTEMVEVTNRFGETTRIANWTLKNKAPK
jgi:hypothetical protein